MRCKLCRQQAVFGPLRFCKEHFLTYFEKKVRYYLDRAHVKGAKILIGVSGGKDSAAVADILARVKDDYGFELSLFTINLQIPGYSDDGEDAVHKLGALLNIPVIVWNLKDYPKQISHFALTKKGEPAKPCSQCGVIKRYLLNKAAVEGGFDYVVTGHNLDDEFYFTMHSLYQQDVVQLLRTDKQLPPRPEQKMAGRLKPLYYLSEKENMVYCLLRNVPIDNRECPFSVGNPQLKFKLENANLGRDKKASVLKVMRKLKVMVNASTEKKTTKLNDCPTCGYPTTRDDACIFCRLMTNSP